MLLNIDDLLDFLHYQTEEKPSRRFLLPGMACMDGPTHVETGGEGGWTVGAGEGGVLLLNRNDAGH